MRNPIGGFIPVILFALLPLLPVACGGSRGGAADGEVRVEYRVEMIEGDPECLSRIQYLDRDGNTRTERDPGVEEWSERFYAGDGTRLFLEAVIDCGRVEVSLYLARSRAARDRSPRRATIEGTLRVDEEGNATFEED